MASRSRLSRNDNSMAERRLRPIYEWIDNGNYKKALHELDKLIKKLPSQNCSKALKSLTLVRLGKDQEAETLLKEVRKCKPSDESTLLALTACYRELKKPHMVCEVYEDALLQDPVNEELLSSLFMSYVRVCDYKKQQQTALALHKVKPNNPYYFWAIMSIVMQAYQANDEISKRITLPLAERMVQKYINEDKIDAEQEIQLYLMILDMQKKYKESLDILNGPLGDKLHRTVGLTRKKIDIYFELEMYGEANSYLKSLLLKDIDSWIYYTKYYDSLFKIIESKDKYLNCNGDTGLPHFDSSIEEALLFLNELQKLNSEQNYPQRGVYLARLELYSRLKENANKYMGDAINLLTEYFKIFGQKPCCFYDLRPYMSLLKEELLDEFLKILDEIVNLKEGEFPKTKSQMECYLSYLQLARHVGIHDLMNTEEKLKLADRLLRCYHRCEIFNNSKRSSEIMANDTFVIMMAHLMYDIWVENNRLTYIREATVVLEYAYALSPSNFHIKLLLLKFYHMLGASDASNLAYINLEIKNTQLDSLGYLHTFQMFNEGRFQNASKLYATTIRFFSHNYREVADHLTISYKFGSFIKIIEFVEFREKLKYSIHHSMCLTENYFISLLDVDNLDDCLEIILKMNDVPEIASKSQLKKMINNRDYSVLINYNPPTRCLTTEHSNQIFSHDLRLLEIRAVLLSCIYYSARMIKQFSTQHFKTPSEVNGLNTDDESLNSNDFDQLNFHLKTLKTLNTQLESDPPVPVPNNVFGSFFGSKLFGLDKSKTMLTIVINFIEFIQIIGSDVKTSVSTDDEWTAKMKTNANELTIAFDKSISYCKFVISKTINEIDSSLKLEGRKEVLEVLTNMIDTLNTSCIFLSLATYFIKSYQNKIVSDPKKIKAKRKTHSTPYNPETQYKGKSEILREVMKTVQNSTSHILACVKNVEEAWNRMGCGNSNALMLKKHDTDYTINDTDEGKEADKIRQITADRWRQLVDTIDKKISDSYSGALDEMIKILIKKQTQINKLPSF
ncbi:N-alpha-acetyltransferase 25, NatB auxiliary subunit-like [Rhopalosiphum maidis]|uniref:N-alpha-acetyltransferase 25, NatB auxiliary subunit-like n=1 Tax=Rhopalosiphum maidis TaxID=43146 RepID=UPI000F00872A|nr:N-alpha-acetyltransferase 25, NatB auxiliary subunit-like [Rhopalosiphum maidis]XP_026815756.1 N-alpha-acetyltransferase 25, NatB auxiliary subunit-like [Rhopalosiphum maidis]XP_026815791.1 N-alpha-acetyltransferase 25, NatB auxiliary subunit-like [Rhopalosiphum maidis]XP_026815792.1 N-alpha-acetyltransferase 25, NatB auxiliary subunit-like [Rhopalosiphum maidis]